MAAIRLDGTHLREKWLPRLNQFISSASFAKNRYRVQRVYVCAAVISQDEAVIDHLLATMPSFSATQDALDWQPDSERRSAGDVYSHLMGMSNSGDCPKPDQCLFQDVESSKDTHSICSHSFRLSSLEICNASTPKGYHIGATALQRLAEFEDCENECEKWRKLLLKYIVDEDDESPHIVWAHPGVVSAVLWQVQLDVVDTLNRRGNHLSHRLKRNRRYGAFAQVPVRDCPLSLEDGDQAPAEKRYRGVRLRRERDSWVAETRLPKGLKKNKVSFGDFKSDYEAARAVDVVFHHYGKPVTFLDTPRLLSTQRSLEGLEGEAKLKAVKEQAKWLAANAPPPSTSPPSSSIATAYSLQETIASPSTSTGFSRSSSGRDNEGAVDDTLEYVLFDDLMAMVEQVELNQAVDDQYEQSTRELHPSFDDEMFLTEYESSIPSSTATYMYTTDLFS